MKKAEKKHDLVFGSSPISHEQIIGLKPQNKPSVQLHPKDKKVNYVGIFLIVTPALGLLLSF